MAPRVISAAEPCCRQKGAWENVGGKWQIPWLSTQYEEDYQNDNGEVTIKCIQISSPCDEKFSDAGNPC